MRTLAAEAEQGWDELVLALQSPHVLQSSAWGALKGRWGWSVHRFAWGPPRAEVAAALALVRPVGRTGQRVGYIPKGPLVNDPAAREAWAEVLPDLERWARSTGLLTLKIDPGVPARASTVTDLLRAHGWRSAVTQVQFPNTMCTDLSVGTEALLAGMKSKTRYNIRLAERRGVRVRYGDEADLPALYALYVRTAARGGFGVRAWPYYRDAWVAFLRREMGALILAERDGEPLAAVFPVSFGDTAWYLYGASADHGREHMPAYLAQWESLRWAVERGCRRYDWWGGPTRMDEADPLWGVYQFKRGFGARMCEQIGAWDYPAKPLAFLVYRWLERGRNALVARRSGPARTAGTTARTL